MAILKRAAQAAKILQSSLLFQQSQHIACYYPYKNEFDCLPIIQKIWQAKKNCYLPVLTQKTLGFAKYQENTELQLNRYNILEPSHKHFIVLENLDLVLLPLLGFDFQGNRLGMGAGFYDYTFQALRFMKKPFLLGLGYAVQHVSILPQDPWDVVLDGILTEKNLILLSDII